MICRTLMTSLDREPGREPDLTKLVEKSGVRWWLQEEDRRPSGPAIHRNGKAERRSCRPGSAESRCDRAGGTAWQSLSTTTAAGLFPARPRRTGPPPARTLLLV